MTEAVECYACGKETNNYYKSKTNTKTIYRCVNCHELGYMRDQREEYGLTYQNCEISARVKRKF